MRLERAARLPRPAGSRRPNADLLGRFHGARAVDTVERADGQLYSCLGLYRSLFMGRVAIRRPKSYA